MTHKATAQPGDVHPLVLQAIKQGFAVTVTDRAVLARIAQLVQTPADREVRRAA